MAMNPEYATTFAHPQVSVLCSLSGDTKMDWGSVASCLAQTATEYELILLVDENEQPFPFNQGRLTDNRVRVVGTGDAALQTKLAKGCREARAPYICVCLSSDRWQIDKLARQRRIARDSGADIVVDAQGWSSKTAPLSSIFARRVVAQSIFETPWDTQSAKVGSGRRVMSLSDTMARTDSGQSLTLECAPGTTSRYPCGSVALSASTRVARALRPIRRALS